MNYDFDNSYHEPIDTVYTTSLLFLNEMSLFSEA